MGGTSTPTVTFNNGIVTLNNLKGATGSKGDKGDAATISIDSVVTGSPGTNATVENKGNENDASFKFVIPRGDKGETGATGAAAGFGTPTASVDSNVGTPSVTVTSSGSNTSKIFDFKFKNLKGVKGEDGKSVSMQSTGNTVQWQNTGDGSN